MMFLDIQQVKSKTKRKTTKNFFKKNMEAFFDGLKPRELVAKKMVKL
jgi:hypothetical protein